MIVRITIPEGDENDFRRAFGRGYEPQLPDGTENPQTKMQYAKQNLVDYVIEKMVADRRENQPPVIRPTITVD